VAHLILFAFLYFAYRLIKIDIAYRDGVSKAIWIPTLWVGILASRPVSTWIGFGGGTDTIEGSPIDRLFFFGSIVAALIVISRRPVPWSRFIGANWPTFLFYAFLLVSVLWAESTVVSFKRWIKDFGNIFVALVILTEANPTQAFRAVFVRCAYVLIPLSEIFIRYFPNLGRRYSIHSGEMEATGVTFQKNSLGAMVMVCGIVLLWDWIERRQRGELVHNRLQRYMPPIILAIGFYLLRVADSKTSIACLTLGGLVVASVQIPILRGKIRKLGMYAMGGGIIFFALDSMVGIKEQIVESLGRDMTFTGRTDVWRELLALKTDPVLGTGFCSFWSDDRFRSRLPDWVAFSAHNGYIEMYIDGGTVGVVLLGVMLIGAMVKLNRNLATESGYALTRFAILIITLIGNLSESHYGRMSPLWFLFLLASMDPPMPEEEPVGSLLPTHA
jgi:exopolysaccharide production protein ExoQ